MGNTTVQLFGDVDSPWIAVWDGDCIVDHGLIKTPACCLHTVHEVYGGDVAAVVSQCAFLHERKRELRFHTLFPPP